MTPHGHLGHAELKPMQISGEQRIEQQMRRKVRGYRTWLASANFLW